jgi:NAD(P)-dependent dehydrogenase (short-subunit alcohol dehydrogenase family)
MRKQGGGVIVNVSSGLSKRILPGVGPYASTKYALNALTLTARAELAEDNIRVGLVIPGRTINTSFGQNAVASIVRPQSAPPLHPAPAWRCGWIPQKKWLKRSSRQCEPRQRRPIRPARSRGEEVFMTLMVSPKSS